MTLLLCMKGSNIFGVFELKYCVSEFHYACLFIHPHVQFKNCWLNFHEIWYEGMWTKLVTTIHFQLYMDNYTGQHLRNLHLFLYNCMGWLVRYLPKQKMVRTEVLRHGPHMWCSMHFFKTFMFFEVIQWSLEDILGFLCSSNIYDFLKPNTQRILNMCSPIVMPTELLLQKFECNPKYIARIIPHSKDFGEYFSVRNWYFVLCESFVTLPIMHTLFSGRNCVLTPTTQDSFMLWHKMCDL